MHFNINVVLSVKGLLPPLHKWKLKKTKDMLKSNFNWEFISKCFQVPKWFTQECTWEEVIEMGSTGLGTFIWTL